MKCYDCGRKLTASTVLFRRDLVSWRAYRLCEWCAEAWDGIRAERHPA